MGGLVFRRSHNGQVSAYPEPDMSRVKWSQAQKDHRRQMGEAFRYASAAVADPDIRPVYVQMALDRNENPKRPFDTAVSDYSQGGPDLLWRKYMGDQDKPKNWNITTPGTTRKATGANGAEEDARGYRSQAFCRNLW